ncbi:class I SAM-dependent methyltransferase [Massilia cavernae]|uniref:Methyltransferase domain-containing protein n=1 Tax=Massilia cavernae TaxID=2320864 RepID=A0A418Y778_9BURK|nr:methyltransferase domain-containing protein [Massilia cavernae]RJG25803.1 methyltransferase domain-containing protein [Massilia cavernae]
MKVDEKELGVLLDHADKSPHLQWNRKRIISCINFLHANLPLTGRRTLDLGHDVSIGALMAHLGCQLRGNVAPVELNGPEKARDSASFTSPTGEQSNWALDAFDFEGKFPYADATFELITTMEVIEHVASSPRAFIKEIKRVLVPGGHLFIATPNAASWAKIMRQFAHAPTYDSKPYSETFGPRHVMCHVYEYTPWELKDLLMSEGFEITAFQTWDAYDCDPRGIRQAALKFLITAAMVLTGHVRLAALLHRNRGHQMGLIARLKPAA